jgi:hypothetical protein
VFQTVATIAAIFLIIEVMVIVLVVGALFFAGWKGMDFVLRKAAVAFAFARGLIERTARFAETAGYKAVAPVIWLYSRAAWLRGIARALWRGGHAVG